MFSTAEIEARQPLINHLKNYFPDIDESTSTRELVRKTQLIGGGSDPLLARAIRRCEDVEQNSKTERSAINDERNDAWFTERFNACITAHWTATTASLEVSLPRCSPNTATSCAKRSRPKTTYYAASLPVSNSGWNSTSNSATPSFASLNAKNGCTKRGADAEGERGPKGERGLAGRDGRTTMTVLKVLGVKGWAVDAADYSAQLVLADGSRSAKLDLRPSFERFLIETT